MEMLERTGEVFAGFVTSFREVGLWKLIGCVVVIFAALILNAVITGAIFKCIEKRLDKLHGGKSAGSAFLDSLKNPVRLLVIIGALYICVRILGVLSALGTALGQIEETLIIIVIFWALFNVAGNVKDIIGTVSEKAEVRLDRLAASYVSAFLRCIVVVFGSICLLNVWVSDVSGLIAGISIGAVAITLATQDIASNFVGSIMVMIDRPFNIGDRVEIGTVIGCVEDMGMRSTRIRRDDRSLAIVPNKTVSSANIINRSSMAETAMTVEIGVTYNESADELKAVMDMLAELLRKFSQIKNDSISAVIVSFGAANSAVLNLKFVADYSSEEKHVKLKGELGLEIAKAIKGLGVTVSSIK